MLDLALQESARHHNNLVDVHLYLQMSDKINGTPLCLFCIHG